MVQKAIIRCLPIELVLYKTAGKFNFYKDSQGKHHLSWRCNGKYKSYVNNRVRRVSIFEVCCPLDKNRLFRVKDTLHGRDRILNIQTGKWKEKRQF